MAFGFLLCIAIALTYLVKLFIRMGRDQWKSAAKAGFASLCWFGASFACAVAMSAAMAAHS